VPSGEDLPTPVLPPNWKELYIHDAEDDDCVEGWSTFSNASYISQNCEESQLIEQSELNDLVHVVTLL
jgi:hypothetical protein